MPLRSDLARSVLIALAAFAAMMAVAGNRVAFVSDEGLYLDGAIRVLAGAQPYRDFFALTGPGTFWTLALVFKVLGVSLWSARVLFAADIGMICGCLYWIASRCVSARAGLWLCGCYLGLLAADAGNQMVNHRWDSAALSMGAVALVLPGARSKGQWGLFAAGAAGAYAVWTTPPVGLVSLVLLAWTLKARGWKGAAALCGGAALVSGGVLGVLLSTGSLAAFWKQVFWAAGQYSGANRMAYGTVIGGYGQFFAGAQGIGLAVTGLLVGMFALPAIAPVLALAGLWRPQRSDLAFLTVAAIAMVASCAPRLDVGHLATAAPMAYLAAVCGVAVHAPPRLARAAAAVLTAGALLFALTAAGGRMGLPPAATRVGTVTGSAEDLNLVRTLEREVPAGEAFFAFPYLPAAYFFTRAHNPTRYSFLQPGMMSDLDEMAALDQLRRAMPVKVLYAGLPPEAYQRLFPSSDPTRLRMHRVEAWLEQNYRTRLAPPHIPWPYQLLERK